MQLNEQQKQELTAYYGKRFEPLLTGLVDHLAALVGDGDQYGLAFLVQSITQVLGAAVRRLPDQTEEKGTVH